MDSVAFRGFEEDGQSLVNFNDQTTIMSHTGWLGHARRGSGLIARRNGNSERSAINVAVSEHQIKINSLLSVKSALRYSRFKVSNALAKVVHQGDRAPSD